MTALVKNFPSELAIARKVDRLGALNAQLAHIADQAEAIKDELRAMGAGDYEGRYYKAVVSWRQTVRIDIEKVRAILTKGQLAKCSKTSTSTAITVYGL